MRVNYITIASPNLASYRYRIENPALQLAKRGHSISIGAYDAASDVVVFSKHFNMDADYRLMLKCKKDGKKTVFDVCDNHFDDGYADYYSAMCEQADKVVVGTHPLMMKLGKGCVKKTVIVNDAYEFPEMEPAFSPDGDPKLLWFGHASNLYSLERILPDISEYELRIISNTERMPCIPWSMRAVKEGLEWCDLVIIPATDECKGANRTIESFRMGKYVIAEPHPANKFLPCWSGDIPDGIKWSIDHPQQVRNNIEKAQIDIQNLFSPDVIGEQWERALA